MRFSFAIVAVMTVPALLTVTACQASEPVKGTVVEKEHHPAKQGTSTKTCYRAKQSNGRYKDVCPTPVSGAKAECYELEIRTSDGSEVDVCDKAAYSVLDIDDPYDSTQDYSRGDQ